jgi:hypothetical protein
MAEAAKPEQTVPAPLKDAVRAARIDAAERSGVVVDLRDAELARLELLNDALDPLFKEIPSTIDLFDRGISRGDTPRLWVDIIAHVGMGRDKRQYRFVQDTRFGRAVLAESYELPPIVEAVTNYVARRLVERERALADDASSNAVVARRAAALDRRSRRWGKFRAFVLGIVLGVAALFVLALVNHP